MPQIYLFAAKTPNILRKFAENRRSSVDSASLRRTEKKFYWSRRGIATNRIFAAPNEIFAATNRIFAVKLAMRNEQLPCTFTSLKVHFSVKQPNEKASNNRMILRQITE
jgi:hypothetical protein